MNLILASGSESRRRVLEAAGVPFRAVPADIDESALKHSLLQARTSLPQIAGALADAKALHVSHLYPEALVVGGDQTLLFGSELISKCDDLAGARDLLTRLGGRQHQLIGALTLAQGGAVLWRHVETAQLWMRDFSASFLDDYLAKEGTSLLSAVGCYKLEGLGAQLFERIEGDYFSVLGLPLLPLLAVLRKHGVIAT